MQQAQLTLASSSVELERLVQTANCFIHSAKAPATLKYFSGADVLRARGLGVRLD